MKNLIKWLKSEGINVYLVEMDKKGMCILERNTILISSKISEQEQIKVVYHELKHFDHKDYIALYKQFIYHSKFEYEADTSVIVTVINDNEGLFNYTGLIEEFNIGIGYESRYEGFIKQRNTLLTD